MMTNGRPQPEAAAEGERASRLSQWWMSAAERLDRRVGWDKLPMELGIPTLFGLRDRLRRDNLFGPPVPESDHFPLTDCAYRTADGTGNDLAYPMMGAANTPFGRNVPLADCVPEAASDTLCTPNPKTVSEALLTRDRFIPAATLNMLAGAWIQFEVHDWFSHGRNQKKDPIALTAEPGTPSLLIERTREGDAPGVFRSEDTHWWDGSQLYGASVEQQQKWPRDGARLKVEDGTIPARLVTNGFFDLSGRNAGFWTGLAAMHTLFALEHNAICEHLCRTETRLRGDDEKLFQVARLVNVALMAKIHTTEWTPAVLAHPTARVGLKMSWWGISRRLKRSLGRLSINEVISGIPGSPANHHGAPYCLTEEFAAVYRMHSLLPDEFVFRSPFGGTKRQRKNLADLLRKQAIPVLRDLEMPTVLYTFGVSHPGALTLHNYPDTMQGEPFNLAATDIVRDRERGVPRYNRFRAALHKAPVRDFSELSDNSVWVEEIREVYNGKIDQVDLMIGLLAEPRPCGFGFSDTAFRVFLLMAARRLKSDRFFTDCYNEEHYTRAGLDWIENNTMKTVLLRHFGRELQDVLEPVENAFVPWAPVAG